MRPDAKAKSGVPSRSASGEAKGCAQVIWLSDVKGWWRWSRKRRGSCVWGGLGGVPALTSICWAWTTAIKEMERLKQERKGWEKKKMYRQIVKQLAFQLLTAFHVNVWDWHFLHPLTPGLPPHTHMLSISLSLSFTLSLSLHLFYFGTLSVSRRIKETGRRGGKKGAGEKGEPRREGEKRQRERKKWRNRRNQTLAGVGERSALTGSEVKLPS